MANVTDRFLRNFSASMLVLFLSGCEAQSPQALSNSSTELPNSSADFAETHANSADISAPTPPLPEHNYTRREGDVYYYTGAISRDAADAGQVSPEVYAFRYLGNNYVKGNEAVLGLDGRGMPTGTAWCANPCEIIHMSTGQMIAYDAHTIIGSAFQDIMDGKLEQPRANLTPAYRASPPHLTQPSSIYQEAKAADESGEDDKSE